jgi:hypothetical protein
MSKYKESDVLGSRYIRANQIQIQNELEKQSITFSEQEIINIGDGEVLKRNVGSLSAVFTPEPEFPLLNPETGEPTGQTMSYGAVYVVLHSLYIHLATERDTNEPTES